jgi:opacity protein-like surface antigen
MKKLVFLFLILVLPAIVSAQFEQKLSINIGSGIFKTFGKKMGEFDPYQMPNYKAGIAENIGLQLNLNRRLSLLFDVGFMFASKWDYENYLHYAISDPVDPSITLAEGYNDLNFSNFSFGVKPKLLLSPGNKWNPYLSLGFYLNFTKAVFSDNAWYDGKELHDQGKLPNFLNDYPAPYDAWLEKNTGLGFNPGAGLEYNLSDKIGFSLSAGYYLLLINGKNFKNDQLIENLNAVSVQAGIRFNFLKSKKL